MQARPPHVRIECDDFLAGHRMSQGQIGHDRRLAFSDLGAGHEDRLRFRASPGELQVRAQEVIGLQERWVLDPAFHGGGTFPRLEQAVDRQRTHDRNAEETSHLVRVPYLVGVQIFQTERQPEPDHCAQDQTQGGDPAGVGIDRRARGRGTRAHRQHVGDPRRPQPHRLQLRQADCVLALEGAQLQTERLRVAFTRGESPPGLFDLLQQAVGADLEDRRGRCRPPVPLEQTLRSHHVGQLVGDVRGQHGVCVFYRDTQEGRVIYRSQGDLAQTHSRGEVEVIGHLVEDGGRLHQLDEGGHRLPAQEQPREGVHLRRPYRRRVDL